MGSQTLVQSPKLPIPISSLLYTEKWVEFIAFFPKLMGSGTHCSKIDEFPWTHGTYTNGATGTYLLFFAPSARNQTELRTPTDTHLSKSPKKVGFERACRRRTMFEMAPKRSESNFGWQPFFSSSWQTLYSKTLQFYYVKLTSHNFWINADKRKIF